MTDAATPTTTDEPARTKHCPGVISLQLQPHDLLATAENFNRNAGSPDGLSARCRVCGAAYGKAWAEAKRKGAKFSARGEAAAASSPASEPATEQAPEGLRYADGVAERAALGKLEGYTTEVVAGVVYALPDGSVAGTPEGQSALATVNAARRAQSTSARRSQRAAKKARESAAATA